MEGSLVAYKVFTNGSVLNASEINDNLMNQSVMVFSNSTARSAALTAPVEGMLTWLEDVNRYENYNGSAWVPLSSGKILQVITQVKTDTTTITAATYQDISNLAVSITPSSATSKILITAQVGAAFSQVEAGKSLSLFRGSTNLFVPASAGSRVAAGFAGTQTSSAGDIQVATFSFLDSPSTTSSTTYSVKGLVNVVTAGNSLFINRSRTDTDAVSFSRTISTITVMEVAA
jgi:hypothetical protein